MSRLPAPVRGVLRDPTDEVAVQRMWREISSRRLQDARPAIANARFAWGGALAAAAVLLIAFAASRHTRALPASVASGPLRTVAGAEISVFATGPGSEAQRGVALDDGSLVTLSPGAQLEALENTGHSFVTHLNGGRVAFNVRPGGPRRWSIECGVATVEVVGTGFVIDRNPSRVRVEVDHGVVLVRGERVHDRVQRLTAGQWLEVEEAHEQQVADAQTRTAHGPTAAAVPAVAPIEARVRIAPPAAASAHAAPVPPPRGEPARTPTEPATASAPAQPWRDLARRAEYTQAYGALGSTGIAQETERASADDLLALADVARNSGHPEDAVIPLRRLLAEHPRDPGAPVAAFTLGRIELDGLGHPQRAGEAFAQAIALGVPRGLSEVAYARLVEARSRAGDVAGAQRAAADYATRFPDGPHAAAVRRWASAP